MGGGHKLNGVIFSVIPGLINKESRGSTMQHLLLESEKSRLKMNGLEINTLYLCAEYWRLLLGLCSFVKITP